MFCMLKSGEGHGNPLQYSCLGNPEDRQAWWATVRGAAEGQTGLSARACAQTHTHTHTQYQTVTYFNYNPLKQFYLEDDTTCVRHYISRWG